MAEPTQEQKEQWMLEDDNAIDSGLRQLMSTRDGRKAVNWIIGELTGFQARNPFVPGDRSLTDYECGKQEVGLRLFDRLTSIQPDLYITLLKENLDERHHRANPGSGNNASSSGDPASSKPEYIDAAS